MVGSGKNGHMATITLKGTPIQTVGELPQVGSQAPDYDLASPGDVRLTPTSHAGRRVVLNIFPNIETGVCQTSVRTFNQLAGSLDNTVVLCVSNDELETLAGFCAAEGLDNVQVASAKGTSFGDDYGITIQDSALQGRLARSVVVIDTDGTVLHTEQLPEIAQEPDYDRALAVL